MYRLSLANKMILSTINIITFIGRDIQQQLIGLSADRRSRFTKSLTASLSKYPDAELGSVEQIDGLKEGLPSLI